VAGPLDVPAVEDEASLAGLPCLACEGWAALRGAIFAEIIRGRYASAPGNAL